MFLPKPLTFAYHVYMLQFLHGLVGLIRFLPNSIANYLLVIVKFSFIALLGFAAWVRNFTDSQFASWFIFSVAVGYGVQKLCYWISEQGKPVESASENDRFEREVETHKSICRTLEYVRAALETKSLVEIQAEKDRSATQVTAGERDKAADIKRRIEMLNNESDRMDEEMLEKRSKFIQPQNHTTIAPKAITPSANAKQLSNTNESFYSKTLERPEPKTHHQAENDNKENHRSVAPSNPKKEIFRTLHQENKALLATVEDLVSPEKQREKENAKALERENTMLRATVEIMTKQRKTMVEKLAESLKRIKVLTEEKESLASRLRREERNKGIEEKYIGGELKNLSDRMQNSLSSARGKLTRVEEALSSDVLRIKKNKISKENSPSQEKEMNSKN